MGIGTGIRAAITTVINKGSTIIITPYSQSSTDSGYSGQVPVDGTPVTDKAIPFDEVKKILKQSFGNLETGGFQLAVKSTTVFDIKGTTKYKVEYNSDIYDITKIDRFAPFEDVLIAYIITLSKRYD